MDLAAIKEKPYYFSNRALKRLIVPMIIEWRFLAILVGMSDSIMVATVGEHAVSGVSLVDNIFVLLICLFAALATGGAVVVGQYLGQNKQEKANRAVNQLILFTALFAICIMIGLYLARNLILHRVFGAIEANVMEASKTYLLHPFYRPVSGAPIPFYRSADDERHQCGRQCHPDFRLWHGGCGCSRRLFSHVISAICNVFCSPSGASVFL